MDSCGNELNGFQLIDKSYFDRKKEVNCEPEEEKGKILNYKLACS